MSFVAPDGTPDDGVYARHMRTPDDAQVPAARLRPESTSEQSVEA